VFSIGVGVFALASVWCGLAPDVGQLIAAARSRASAARCSSREPRDPQRLVRRGGARPRDRHVVGFTAITTAIGPVLGGW
jgi:hypothetical protein